MTQAAYSTKSKQREETEVEYRIHKLSFISRGEEYTLIWDKVILNLLSSLESSIR
jgi:hypothetical protein